MSLLCSKLAPLSPPPRNRNVTILRVPCAASSETGHNTINSDRVYRAFKYDVADLLTRVLVDPSRASIVRLRVLKSELPPPPTGGAESFRNIRIACAIDSLEKSRYIFIAKEYEVLRNYKFFERGTHRSATRQAEMLQLTVERRPNTLRNRLYGKICAKGPLT